MGSWPTEGWGRFRSRFCGPVMGAAAVCLACVLADASYPAEPDSAGWDPPGAVTYTASGAVRQVVRTADGTVWAATEGGVLQWPPGAVGPVEWTTAAGLPSNDIRAIAPDSTGCFAATGQVVLHLPAHSLHCGSPAGSRATAGTVGSTPRTDESLSSFSPADFAAAGPPARDFNPSASAAALLPATGFNRPADSTAGARPPPGDVNPPAHPGILPGDTGPSAAANSPTEIVECARFPAGEEIRSLSAAPGRPLLVATTGGLYQVARFNSLSPPGRLQRKWIGAAWRLSEDGAWAAAARGLLRIEDGKTFPYPPEGARTPSVVPPVTALRASDGRVLLATALGFWQMARGQWTFLSLPVGSPASHVSAIGPGANPLVALYGDGLYRLVGRQWEKATAVPTACRYMTDLDESSGTWIAGTRMDGVWTRTGSRWERKPAPHSLGQVDVYGIAAFQGKTWVATFDQGLLALDANGIKRVTRQDGLSANTPRGLVVYGGSLYVRYATGPMDRFDGKAWKPAFTWKDLPRSDVYCFATDGRRLYLGGYGGWCATDGTTWERHYDEPGLAGQVVTAIAAADGITWVGTQGEALLRYQDGKATRFYEAQGLTDDWITSLAADQGRVLVGTYTGGLLEWKGNRFVQQFTPNGMAIRAIAFLPGSRQALAATPLGLYRETDAGWQPLDPAKAGGLETQAIRVTPTGAWIGARTGLTFLPLEELTRTKAG